MEFKIDQINESSLTANLQIHEIGNSEHNAKCYIEIRHDGKTYNSMYDNFMYLYGDRIATIDKGKLDYVLDNGLFPCDTCNGRYSVLRQSGSDVWRLQCHHYLYRGIDNILIRKPNDTSMIVFKEKIIEKVVEKETIIEKIEIKESLNDIDDCCICYDKKGTVQFGCCSMVYCGICAIKCIDKCAQCRAPVNRDKMKTIL